MALLVFLPRLAPAGVISANFLHHATKEQRIKLESCESKQEKATFISECGLYLMPATTYAPTHFRVQY
ncbi:MAG: hypothetical protein ACLPOO_02200, partial [Terriglobales bacterium]